LYNNLLKIQILLRAIRIRGIMLKVKILFDYDKICPICSVR